MGGAAMGMQWRMHWGMHWGMQWQVQWGIQWGMQWGLLLSTFYSDLHVHQIPKYTRSPSTSDPHVQ